MAEKDELKADGSFKRQRALFSRRFGDGEGALPVEEDRYRLIWAAPCPWSHRVSIVRRILGLEDVISIGMVDAIRPKIDRIDWAFTLDRDGKDPATGAQYLSELYQKTDAAYAGRPTVPAVVDLTTGQVVNNDYFTLTNDLETAWSPFHQQNAPDLYPEELREAIDELNDVVYEEVNNGVYRCGFARSQEAYEAAYDTLFSRLDQLDARLAEKRFLFGDYVTDADVRLYVTLARFDAAYYTVFKANKQRLVDYPNLWGYARELYHIDAFRETTDFEAIKQHYYLSAKLSADRLEEEGIVPKGPDLSGWEELPERSHLSESEEVFYRR